MYPMHSGFMGRKKGADPCALPSGWRYLADEVPNALHVWSKLLTRSAYTGFAVQVPINANLALNNFPFCKGEVDLGLINDTYNTNRSVRVYDQIGTHNMGSQGDGYVAASNNYSFVNYGSSAGAPAPTINWNTPCTFVFIYNRTGNSSGFGGIMVAVNGTPGDSRFWMRETPTGRVEVLFRDSVGQLSRIESTTSLSNGQNLVVMTYDGNPNMSGVNFYFNNMVTATGSTILNSAVTGTFTPSIYYVGGIAASQLVNGRIDDSAIFSGAMSQANRETMKEIYEQYYTFL